MVVCIGVRECLSACVLKFVQYVAALWIGGVMRH